MKILEFDMRIIKTIKIMNFIRENYENHKNLRIPCENHDKCEDPRTPYEQYENHKNVKVPQENQENHRIPFENHEILKS